MNARACTFLAIVLLFVASANAIGISPSRTVLNFTPSMQMELSVTIINNGQQSLPVQLYVRGDLSQYVQFPAAAATISPSSSKSFSYTIRLPSWLAGPKTYDTRIGAVEIPSGSSMVGAVAGVEAQLWIVVPETPRPSVVNGELPPLGSAPAETNQTGQPPATEQPGQPPVQETAQPVQAELLGYGLLAVGSALAATTVLAYLKITKVKTKRHKR